MKATRAYIASLGTTGVLLAASILMLTIVSTLVAFDGWPSGTVTERVDRLTINTRAPAIPVSATTVAVAAPAAGAPAGGAPGAAGPGTGGAPGGTGERFNAGQPAPPAPGAGGVVGGATPSLPNPLPDGGPEIPTIPVPGGDTLKEQLASATEETTGGVGTSLGGQIGDVVTTFGQAAGEVVRALPVGTGQE